MNDNIKDLAELYEEEEMNIYRRFDEVEADILNFYFRRGYDGKIIDYSVTLPFDATYHKFAEYFAKFLSEVYEYQIDVEASTKYIRQSDAKICDGCTNISCLKNKGCS